VNPEFPSIAKTGKKLVERRLTIGRKNSNLRAAAMAGDILILSDGTGQVGDYEFEKTHRLGSYRGTASAESAVSMQMARRLTNDDNSVAVSTFGVSMFSE
jgi:hypothetical protein